MAIGLGRMFGFELPENFNLPYSSRSVRDFWRRWHISLSTWFRDYLYIPLGGNRVSQARQYANLFTVFVLCGLWHGASWNFIVWGAFHGTFLVLERTRFGKVVEGMPRLLQHVYALLVVSIGWVFFRAESLGQAFYFLRALAGNDHVQPAFRSYALNLLDRQLCMALIVGVILSTLPLRAWFARISAGFRGMPGHGIELITACLRVSLLVASLAALASNTFNPFIYYRF